MYYFTDKLLMHRVHLTVNISKCIMNSSFIYIFNTNNLHQNITLHAQYHDTILELIFTNIYIIIINTIHNSILFYDHAIHLNINS